MELVFVFLQSSHLALIDTLMMAYTLEMVSVERVMSCINKFSSAQPTHSDGLIQGLPYDTEDAITTWINKVRAGHPFLWESKTGKVCAAVSNRIFSSFFFFYNCSVFSSGFRTVCQLSAYV